MWYYSTSLNELVVRVEVALWTRWKLRLGDGSKKVIDCSKPLIDLSPSQPEFAPVLSLSVLGCIVSSNGSSGFDFVDCRLKTVAFFSTILATRQSSSTSKQVCHPMYGPPCALSTTSRPVLLMVWTSTRGRCD